MAFKFKKGDPVSQVVAAPIVGNVAGFDLDQETGDVSVKVEWTDADGVEHSRFFTEAELQAVS